MKHFLALLFAVAALAQSPRKEQWLQIKEASPSKVIRQNFKGGTHTIYDADGSIDATLSNNVLTLNDDTGAQRSIIGGNSLGGCGYATLKSGTILSEVTRVDIQCDAITMLTAAGSTRVRITPDIAGSISRMELLSGGVTLVDFQASGSGGTFKVALDATGANGVSATTGGLLYTHSLSFYNPAGTLPIGINIAGFGRGGPATMALPSVLGSDGDCYKLIAAATGQHGYGACGGGGGDMTTNTAQDVTGAKKFLVSQTWKGNAIEWRGLDASDIPRIVMTPYRGTNDATEFQMYNGFGQRVVEILAYQSTAQATMLATHIGAAANGSRFTARGWTHPGAAVGTQFGGGYYWSMPSSDASGSLCSNGAGVTSWGTCGTGVTSVSGTGVIVSSGGTTPVISCPNCPSMVSANLFSGTNLFTNAVNFNSTVSLNNTTLTLSGSTTVIGSIIPLASSIYNLGSAFNRYGTAYLDNAQISSGISVNGTSGITIGCGPGEYLVQPVFRYGVLISGSCSL